MNSEKTMQNDFVEIALLRDDETGAVCSITVKERASGFQALSFAFYKEYYVQGMNEVRRSHWLSPQHIKSLRGLLDQLEERITIEKEKLSVQQFRRAQAR